MGVYEQLTGIINAIAGDSAPTSEQAGGILGSLIDAITAVRAVIPEEAQDKSLRDSADKNLKSGFEGDGVNSNNTLDAQCKYLDLTADNLAKSLEALHKVRDYRDEALDRIGGERVIATNTISVKLDGAVEALSNALAHALAAIHKATAETDRKRMGYGNPKNQDD
jgi:hypothetical protein